MGILMSSRPEKKTPRMRDETLGFERLYEMRTEWFCKCYCLNAGIFVELVVVVRKKNGFER